MEQEAKVQKKKQWKNASEDEELQQKMWDSTGEVEGAAAGEVEGAAAVRKE